MRRTVAKLILLRNPAHRGMGAGRRHTMQQTNAEHPYFQRFNITVPERAAEALARTGNVSQYLVRTVELRWAQWQEALGFLLAKGWPSDRIVQALQALNGVNQVQRGCFDVARLTLASMGTLAESEIASLLVLSEEWWIGNAEIRRVLITPHVPPLRPRHRGPGIGTRGRPKKVVKHTPQADV